MSKPQFINMMSFHKESDDFYDSISENPKPYYDFIVCFSMLNKKTGKYADKTATFPAESPAAAIERLKTGNFDLKNKVVMYDKDAIQENNVLPDPSNFVEPEGNIPPPPPMPHPDDVI